MTNHAQFILFLVILMTCAPLGLTQHADLPPQRLFSHDGKIDTSYDQVKDITTVRLNQMQVYGEPLASSSYIDGDEARIYTSFTYRGRTLSARPKRVLFSLISTAIEWKYTDFRNLTAVVDGKRLKLGALEYLPSFTVSDHHVSQEIAISLPYQTFLRIANGKKVQIRMGPKEFKLEKNHLEALRDLASRMVP